MRGETGRQQSFVSGYTNKEEEIDKEEACAYNSCMYVRVRSLLLLCIVYYLQLLLLLLLCITRESKKCLPRKNLGKYYSPSYSCPNLFLFF